MASPSARSGSPRRPSRWNWRAFPRCAPREAIRSPHSPMSTGPPLPRWRRSPVREIRSAPARLLVADDNKVNRLLLARGLELQGHRVSMAENGRVALEMLAREPFDLLLLDIEMPEMTGFEVLERMGAHAQLRDVPVIVTSSLEGMDHVVRCIELGAEDYLHKPVNPVLLKARIGASLEKKRLRDQQKEMVQRFATRAVAADLDASGFALGGKHEIGRAHV